MAAGTGRPRRRLQRVRFAAEVGAVLTFGLAVVLVVGIPLTFLAHVAVRKVRRQSVHIAVFGLVGLLAGFLLHLGLFYLGGLPLRAVLAVGVSAAAGRAVVNHRPR